MSNAVSSCSKAASSGVAVVPRRFASNAVVRRSTISAGSRSSGNTSDSDRNTSAAIPSNRVRSARSCSSAAYCCSQSVCKSTPDHASRNSGMPRIANSNDCRNARTSLCSVGNWPSAFGSWASRPVIISFHLGSATASRSRNASPPGNRSGIAVANDLTAAFSSLTLPT